MPKSQNTPQNAENPKRGKYPQRKKTNNSKIFPSKNPKAAKQIHKNAEKRRIPKFFPQKTQTDKKIHKNKKNESPK